MKKNDLEFMFLIAGLKPPVPEHRFHPTRKWRFDFAWPDIKLAVEWEGIFSRRSRHTSLIGYAGDCEKYNSAVSLGWRIIRVTAKTKGNDLIGWLKQLQTGENKNGY